MAGNRIEAFVAAMTVEEAMNALEALGSGSDPIVFLAHPEDDRADPNGAAYYFHTMGLASSVEIRFARSGRKHRYVAGTLADMVVARFEDVAACSRRRAKALAATYVAILNEVGEDEDGAYVAVLSESLGISAARARRLVRTLETHGFVQIVVVPSSARHTQLRVAA